YEGMRQQWIDLQRNRLLLDPAAKKLESFAPKAAIDDRVQIYTAAAALYHASGAPVGELRCLEEIGGYDARDQGIRQRYYSLLLTQKPQRLIELSSRGTADARDSASQFTVVNATPALALEAVKARGTGLPPIWTLGYTAITGFYVDQFGSSTADSFHTAL